MKILTTILIAVALLGCGKNVPQQIINSPLTDTGITLATTVGLASIHDKTRQTAVANLLYTYAGGLRTITGNPTPQQLSDQINVFIPDNIKTQYPEISFAVPMVVTAYQALQSKWGGNATSQQVQTDLNRLGTDIENGCSQFTSH